MTNITTLKRASTTFTTAVRNVDHVDDLRAAIELADSLARELDRRKRELRDRAVAAGLATYDVTKRESAPAKALYIRLTGATRSRRIKRCPRSDTSCGSTKDCSASGAGVSWPRHGAIPRQTT